MLRIIAKLDVKPPYVVKPIHFEGLRKMGFPAEMVERYYLQGADEIIYIDIVASLYRRDIIFDSIEASAEKTFVPFAVGGGVNSIEHFSRLFHIGADKVVLNSYALQQDPEIISKAASVFGSQSVVINVEAKKVSGGWECFSDCGRIKSNKSVLDWVVEAQERGAGEVFLQSVDTDGRKRGFDIELVRKVVEATSIPVVAASGAGCKQDVLDLVNFSNPSAVAVSSLLHYSDCTIKELKEFLYSKGIEVNI